MERSQYPSTVCGLHGPMLSPLVDAWLETMKVSRIDVNVPRTVDAAADPRATVGLVESHQRFRQCQRRAGVIVRTAAQAGAADAAVRLVQDQDAGGHRGRGREHIGDAAALAVAAAAALGLVVVDYAVPNADDAGRELAIAGGVEVPRGN